jgi:hypothetical protein
MTRVRLGTTNRWPSCNTFAAVLALLLAAGCIDVGHETEIGCKKDMTEPGCKPPSGGGGSTAKGGSGGAVASGGKGGIAGNRSTAGNAGSAGAAGNTAGTAGNDAEVTSIAGNTPGGVAGTTQ